MKTLKTTTCLFFVLIFVFNTIQAQEEQNIPWNQFRGNLRDGSTEKLELLSWTEKVPDLLWKHELGSGFSEILVTNDRIYTMCSEKVDSVTGSEFMIALDAPSGKEVWKTKVDSIFIDSGGFGDGPRSTPAIDDENVYCLSS